MNVTESLTTIPGTHFQTIAETLTTFPGTYFRTVIETLSELESRTCIVSVSETLVVSGLNISMSINVEETLTYELPQRSWSTVVSVSEELSYYRQDTVVSVLVTESLVIHYNATPTRTPTITPPALWQDRAPPALWQDRVLCSEVSLSGCSYIGSGIYYCEIDGNPYIEVSGVHTKESVAITLQPNPSVGGQYPLICGNYWYCGFRVWVGINCVYGRCGVMINPLSGVELPSTLLRQYAVVDNLKVYIRAKEESGVFGYGIIAYYLVIKYTTTDGFESGEIETVIWSWTYGGSVETKEPYPILVFVENIDRVNNCGKLELMLCPWRGAWHSIVSCAIFDLIRYMWNFIYSIIPQPVKDFMALIYAFLSGVTAVLSLALNPTFITMFTILIFSVFALFLVYLLLEKGPIGVVEFLITVKEFVGSVVDWILKLINTLKP